jgi:hypothetical protein
LGRETSFYPGSASTGGAVHRLVGMMEVPVAGVDGRCSLWGLNLHEVVKGKGTVGAFLIV